MNTILPFLRRWTLGLLLAAAAWVPTATAALIAHDPLYYDPGSGWEERNGGDGWSGSWFSTLSVATNGLAYPGLVTSGRSFVTTGFGGSDQRPLDTARFPALVTDDRFGDFGRTNTVLWVSFLVRRQPGDDSVSPFDFFGLQLSLGFSDRILIGSPRGSTNVWGVTAENSGVPSTNRFTSRPIFDNAVTLLVARLTFGPAGLNDSVALFVDPPLGGDPGSPDLVVAGLDFQFDGIAAAYSGRSHRIELDEPRLGETFADVTPVGSAAPQAFSLTALPSHLIGREFVPVRLTVAVVETLEPGRTVSLSVTGAPPGSVFTTATGEFDWTPGELDGQTRHSIGFVAVDNSVPPQTNARVFELYIAEDNLPPELLWTGPLGVEEGQTLDHRLEATDADEPPEDPFFWLVEGPEGLSLGSDGRILWTPAPGQLDQLYPVRIGIGDRSDSFGHTVHVYARSRPGAATAPPALRAAPSGGGLTLDWEDLPGSVEVQTASDLAAPLWRTVASSPFLDSGRRRLELSPTNPAAFFRLRNLDSVRLNDATPGQAAVSPGTNVFVSLGLAGELAVDDVLEVTEFGLFGATVRRIPGGELAGSDGPGFYLDTSALPLDRAAVAVRVLDSRGGRHGLTVFEVTNAVVQPSGTAPEITDLAWLGSADQVRLPSSSRDVVTPTLFVTIADADGDPARIGLKTTDPQFETTVWEVPVEAAGTGSVRVALLPLAFGPASRTGPWRVEATAIDSTGRRSTPKTVLLEVQAFAGTGALVGPVLRSFTPTNGPAGSVVTLTTEGLDPAALSNAVVRIGDRVATGIGVGTNELVVLVPTDTAGGTVTLETPLGRSTAARRFLVSPEVNVSPSIAHALAGQSLQFALDRRLPATAVARWSVVGPGRIDGSGLFTAPDQFPYPTNAVVRATVQFPGTNLVAEAAVSVEAAPLLLGEAPIEAARGGEVWSEDLSARVEIPAGALPADARIRIARQPLAELPPAAALPEFLGALSLGPDGTVFSEPVTILVPLTRSLPAGTGLSLRFWNTASAAWIDEGTTAEVEPDGVSARARITHFSVPGVFGATPLPGPEPTLASATPATMLEGDLRPIYLEGTHLDGAVTVDVVHADGSPLTGWGVGPLVRPSGSIFSPDDGTRAAFVLDSPVLPGLRQGQTLDLMIRVQRPGGPAATVPFTLFGLDEFDPASLGTGSPGQRITNLYSEIVVDRPLRNLRHEVIDLQATRRVVVNGEVDVSGRPGPSATDSARSLSMGPGVRDGAGSGGHARFTAEYLLPAATTRVGFGGADGASYPDAATLVQFACPGAEAEECFEELLEEIRDDPFDEVEDAPENLVELLASIPDGRRGASGLWSGAPEHWFVLRSHAVISDNPRFTRGFGPGSGGGGGGSSGSLHRNPQSRRAGGGGGEGGGAVRLVSARNLHLNGLVRADGGPGGAGATTSRAGYSLQGGGGGGGGAGAIRLLAGSGLYFTGIDARLLARGGRPGSGGIATRPENVGFGLWAEVPYSEDPNTATGMEVAEGALFDETRLANGVVLRNVLRLVPRRAPEAWFRSLPGSAGLNPDRPHVVVRRADGSASRRCYFHTLGALSSPTFAVNLVLYPGVNIVELGGPGEELLHRHVVCLSGPDADGDGLSAEDELSLGTDPNAVDSDGDTLGDVDELLQGGDPVSSDTDGDLLRDDTEIALGTVASNPDSDGDGLWDSLEVFLGRSPTETGDRSLRYEEKSLFTVALNARGERILALLDPASGRLGALGRMPGNRADGLTFDHRGTLYVSRGSELHEWAGSIPYERPNTPPGNVPIGVGAGGGGSGLVGGNNIVAPPPAQPGSFIADIRTIITRDGEAVFSRLGELRSTNAFGAFVLPVEAGPMTYDPNPGAFNVIHGVASAGGAAGNTFHLTNHNRFVPPVVNAFIPGAGVGQPVKALAFGKGAGYFALLGPPGGDVFQQIQPLASGTVGNPFPLGRSDALATVSVGTNEFLLTTGSREVLSVSIDLTLNTLSSTPLATTVAPCLLLARVPCTSGCYDPNPVTGSGPLGPDFRARGFQEADFNGDGFLDLAVCGRAGTQAKVHILHGDGTGRFTTVAEHVLGDGDIATRGRLSLGLADGDALPDLAVAWSESSGFGGVGRIVVLRGTADGRFLAPTDAFPAASPFDFALGDFDGATPDDLAVAHSLPLLAHGNAAGTFDSIPADTLLPSNQATFLVGFSDLDRDGRADLVRLGEYVSTHSGGSLQATWQSVLGFGGGSHLEFGDWDGDGNTDVFLAGYPGFVSVLPGNGDGTFDRFIHLYPGRFFGSEPKIAVGDLDQDGLDDVVMGHPFAPQLLVLGSTRPGSALTERAVLPLPFIGLAPRIADFNSDGIADIAVMGTTGAIQVLLGR